MVKTMLALIILACFIYAAFAYSPSDVAVANVAPRTTEEVEANTSYLEAHLKGVLIGQGSVIETISSKYNVDPLLLVAIMLHESANGTSDFIRNRNNPAGLKWRNGETWLDGNSHAKFATLEDGISRLGLTMYEYKVQYKRNTLYKIGSVYAEDASWYKKVAKIYKNLGGSEVKTK